MPPRPDNAPSPSQTRTTDPQASGRVDVGISDRLDGRRALVTGASKATGAAIAGRLRDTGATVPASARTRPADYPNQICSLPLI
jgi:hypothetical protein